MFFAASRNAVGATFLVLVLAGVTSTARANTPEALFGLGSRANGMGGAGTAIANDFTAVYYNPAGLGYCGRSEAGIDIRHAAHNVHYRSSDTDIPPLERVENTTRATIGACFRLPYRLSLGIIFGTGLQTPAAIDQSTANDTPQYLLYGESHQQLSIAVGIAYRPVRQFSIGFGGAIIINSDLDIDVFAPIGLPEGDGYVDLAFDLDWKLKPTAAPYLGITVQPIPQLRFAATYRGPLKHHLDIPVATDVSTAMILNIPEIQLDLPLIITADTWFQPRELALGVAVDPIPEVTITADLTWYNYGAYNDSPYPFLQASWDPNSDSFLPAIIGVPQADPIGYRDIWQPRIGVEARLLDSRLGIRAGYSLRPRAVAVPATRNTNMLDNTVNSISVGAGYTFGPRNREEIVAREVARRAEMAEATADADDAQSATPDETRPRTAFGDDRDDLDDPADSMPVVLRLDAYFRANILREREDWVKDSSYGGSVMEVGLTSSIGWY